MLKYSLEICANSVQSVINAYKGGAHRVELCDSLYEGGTTPSAATIQLARKYADLELFVIIRPRGGDFCYTDLEYETMKVDIEIAKKLGADGVVFGILKPNGTIDKERCEALVALAKPMQVTLHRAFDMTIGKHAALETLIDIGVDRVLTSGGQNKAIEGISLLKELQEQAMDRIKIMAGSGVRANNVEELWEAGIREFHLSGKTIVESQMIFRNPQISMGGIPKIPEYGYELTNVENVRAVIQKLEQLSQQ